MSSGRKRVGVYSPNVTLGASMRYLLHDHDVVIHTDLPADLDSADMLIWDFDGPVQPEMLASVAGRIPTLVLADRTELLTAVDAGSRGFLPRAASLDEISGATNTILAGGAVVPPDLLGTLLRHVVMRNRRGASRTEALQDLTRRELEVFGSAATGASREEIAEQLFISPATVRTHLQRVYRKLGIHSQVELISLAVKLGMDTMEQ